MIKDILNINDIETVAVEVPEWKTTVHVRNLSGEERTQFQVICKQLEKSGKTLDANTHLVLMCACEANGERCFSKDDFAKLNSKSAKAIERVTLAALKLNGMAEDAVGDAKKNLEKTDNLLLS